MALFKVSSEQEKPMVELDHAAALSAGGRMIVARRPDRLKAIVDLLETEDEVHYVSDGEWNLHDFFNAMLQRIKPAELWLTTYAIYEFPIRQILLAQEAGDLTAVHMLLDSRAKVRMPATYMLAEKISNRIALTGCHAKVMVLRNTTQQITLITSQNWTNNPRIEVGYASKKRQHADFHISWIDLKLQNAELFK